MNSFFNLSALFVVVVVASGQVRASTCTRDGKTYMPGEHFKTSPCESCECTPTGQIMCMAQACMYPACVDPTNDPDVCCQTCPNGENCQHSDGTIIKKGDVYHPDQYTTCMCPTSNFMMGSQIAICTAEELTNS